MLRIGAARDRFEPDAGELERAARRLLVQSRREATGAFAGGYRSAFRGGGIEFEESRPYVPGDDVRAIDWNVLARTGAAYVKRYREERDQTALLAVDLSASMAFGSTGRTKAAVAAHAAALIQAAAVRAGDRVGLFTFDDGIRDEIPPGRGRGQAWRVLRALVDAPRGASGGTGLAARDDGSTPRAALLALARRHEVIAIDVVDPRELAIPRAGTLRVADPEDPERTFTLRSGPARARQLYRTAADVRHRALARRLRADGVELLTLRTDRDVLRVLARFFWRRANERLGARR